MKTRWQFVRSRWLICLFALLLLLAVGLPCLSLGLSTALAANLAATNSPQLPGGIVNFTGDGFGANEILDAIVTGPDGKTLAIKYGNSNDQGQVFYSFNTDGCATGRWYLTLRGQVSKTEATTFFDVTLDLSAPTPTPGGGPAPTPVPGGGAVPTPTPAAPPQGSMQVTPGVDYAGQLFNITGSGFKVRETVVLWETDPNKVVGTLPSITSDDQGNITYNYQSHGPTAGIWAVTAHGQTSGVEKTAFFRVLTTASALPDVRLDPTQGNSGTAINVYGTNFFPSETYTYWATGPDGTVYGGVRFIALKDGSLYFLYNLPNATPGRWAITVHGIYSNREAVAYFISSNS